MIKYLKYLLLVILLLVCACTTLNSSYTTEYNTQMMNEYEEIFTQWQLDSICDVDGIVHDLNKWYIVGMRDYETKENVTQYLYIHTLGEYECIYRVQKMNDGTYKITKRITK